MLGWQRDTMKVMGWKLACRRMTSQWSIVRRAGRLAILLITPRKESMMPIALPLSALLAFSGYTVSVMLQAEQSLIDFGISLMSRPDTAQVVIDLYLLATLAGVWMVKDAKGRGRSVWSVLPYLLLTAVFVSIGPLLYLVVRGIRDRRESGTKASAWPHKFESSE
jgi:hypothetical protein